MELDLKVKPFEKDGINHDTLRLSLSYDKSKKGPVLSLQTAQTETGIAGGFSSFRCSLFGSPSARLVIESGWKMNNAKRMAASWDQVLGEVAGKRGQVWEAVEALLKKAGTELVAPEAVAV